MTGEWDFVAIVHVARHEQLREVISGGIGRADRRRAHADDGRLRGLLQARPRGDVLHRPVTTAVHVRSLSAILVVAAFVLAGCGSNDDDPPQGRVAQPETTTTADTATATAPAEQPVTITERAPARPPRHADRDGTGADADRARGVTRWGGRRGGHPGHRAVHARLRRLAVAGRRPGAGVPRRRRRRRQPGRRRPPARGGRPRRLAARRPHDHADAPRPRPHSSCRSSSTATRRRSCASRAETP